MMLILSAEEDLINRLESKKLKDSLFEIREAVDALWGGEIPRIIKYYTDHGMRHCGRIAENAVKLLAANKGDVLSENELYLLIAGIYLHDIGMQCDIAKHPEILKRSEELKANSREKGYDILSTPIKLDINTRDQSKYEYTTEEQYEIRNNHHYFSAAWIEYAFNESKTW